MAERNTTNGLNFGALRLAIERCDPDLVLGFYADDARISILNAQAQRSILFELKGKAEISKYLRATFAPETSHRVEREDIVGEDRVTFREACEYPDGDRVWVETTLEVRDGKIFRQVDVATRNSRAGTEKEIGRSPPTQKGYPQTRPEVNIPLPARLPRLEQATEKEDLG